MVLLLDNYDSFTYNLRDYILQCGKECHVIRNDEMSLDEIEKLNFSSAIISPGPKTPSEAGITMKFIESFHQTKPILGICLGHQAIGEFFGAKLVKAIRPMHGKTSNITHNRNYFFKNLPDEFDVMRYHSLILKELEKTELQITATTKDGDAMAITHPTLKIVGMQFHPESILTPHGLQLMKNWFREIDN
ncbi:MAG: aminodeoxychorismate/anthranilate synthase component II [Bacteroidetes bacterium]|nr:aminodeoxychorismate/anthranilate synthase component II [Bacteroidota bacterium]